METSPDSGQRGQALIYVSLAMLLILLIVSLAIDVGNTYSERRRMQNAADAGALAGANALCMGTPVTAASAIAATYAVGNGAATVAVNIDTSKYVVQVNAGKIANLFLAPAVGIADPNVGALARAACGSTSSACGLFPVAFQELQWLTQVTPGGVCDSTKDIYVWTGDFTPNGNQPTPTPIPSGNICDVCDCTRILTSPNQSSAAVVFTGVNRGWIDFSGNADPLYPGNCVKSGCGAQELSCLILNNSGTKISLPACVTGDSGIKAGVKNAVETRAATGDTVKIPLFDSTGCTAPPGACTTDTTYNISKFGCVTVVGWEQNLDLPYLTPPATGNNKCMTGKFIHVRPNCTEGACETNCGHTIGGGPTPGTVLGVNLIK